MKRKATAALMAALLVLSLAACGKQETTRSAPEAPAQTEAATQAPTAAPETTKAPETTTAAPETTKAPETTAAPTTEAPTTAAPETEAAKEEGDAGVYVVYEYEASGQKITHELMEMSGMTKSTLTLEEGGKGTFLLFDTPIDITWKPGTVTAYGTTDYSYTIDGDKMFLDMAGVKYTLVKDDSAAPAEETIAAEETKAEETKAEETKEDAGETKAAAADGAELYINDGTVTGVYSLWSFVGTPLAEWAEISGESIEDTAKSMQIELKDNGKVVIAFDGPDGEPQEADYVIEGETLKVTAEGETVELTIKDGIITLSDGGMDIQLARLTDAAFAVPDKGEATVWNGMYTKFVGDPEDAKEEAVFTLELYEDGTGVHHRDDLDIKVTWEQDGDEFKMTENFIGTIDYTGFVKDGELHLFNGDPEDDFTCEYVYKK